MISTPEGSSSFGKKKIGLTCCTGLSLLAVLLLLRRLSGDWQQFPPVPLALFFTVLCFLLGTIAVVLLNGEEQGRQHFPFQYGKQDNPLAGPAASNRARRGMYLWRMTCAVILPTLIGLTLISPKETAGQMAVISLGLFLFCIILWWPTTRPHSHPGTSEETVPETGCLTGTESAGILSLHSEAGETVHGGSSPGKSDEERRHPTNKEPREEPFGEMLAVRGSVGLSAEPEKNTADCWMMRRFSDDGSQELVEGEATARFAAGQQQTVLHVAFCPPLCGWPEVECVLLTEADIRWKVVTKAPYGLRIDLTRRNALESPLTVRIGYSAAAPLVQHSAA